MTTPINDGSVTANASEQMVLVPREATEATEAFQTKVLPWLLACFGEMIAGDREERNHRFLEEALELVQACGCTASEAHQLVDYVYGRPVGELHQEIGGVMVTLAALCLANDADMHAAGWVELDRIWGKVEAIRAKQAAKPKHSPLPMHAAPPVTEEMARLRADNEKLRKLAMGQWFYPPDGYESECCMYPGIARATLLIALDNGGINRNRSEEQQRVDLAKWIDRGGHGPLAPIDNWLAGLTNEQLEIVCCGEDRERAAVMVYAPRGTDDLLNAYFDEVC